MNRLIMSVLVFGIMPICAFSAIDFDCESPKRFTGLTFSADGKVEKGRETKVLFKLYNFGRTTLDKNVSVRLVFDVKSDLYRQLTLEDATEPRASLNSIILKLVDNASSTYLSKVRYGGNSYVAICQGSEK